MNATVHAFPTPESAFHLARCVLLNDRAYHDEAVQAAIEVLQCSANPADIQTVRLLRHREWAIDGGEFPQDWPQPHDWHREQFGEPWPLRMRIIGFVVLFLALIAGAVLLERAWTEANAAVIFNERNV